MKSKLFLTMLAIAVVAFGAHAGETTKVTVDSENSTVGWFAKKVGGAHDGYVDIASGTLMLDGKDLKGGNFVMDMSSISCADISNEAMNAKLVNHLKSPDFFNTEEFPKASLAITGVEKLGEGSFKVAANITIKGITKPITFEANMGEADGKVTASAEIELDRTDFDVRYGSKKFFDNLGDKFIYDNFKLAINLMGK